MVRLSVAILTAALVTGSLVACSNGYGVPQTASISTDGSAPKTSVAPVELRSSETLAKIHAADRRDQADAVTPGIYASANYVIYGYSGNDRSNGPPACSVAGSDRALADIAVDRKGDVLVSEFYTSRIYVFAGPGLCGPELGSIADPYGPPLRVASRNAANGGKIVVATLGNGRGSVAVCTLSGGCTANLTTRGGRCCDGSVALAPNGDCWAAGSRHITRHKQIPALGYFAHCRGVGVLATGFENGVGFGAHGLDIDESGNLVALGGNPGSLYIYSGCNPACRLVGGPFPLRGGVADGHLDANSKMFVAAVNDFPHPSRLDLYSYSTSGIKYEYSISNGLASGVEGAAFSPASKE